MPDPEPSDPSDPETSKTVTLTERDIKDAARLFSLLADPAILGAALPASLPPLGQPGPADRETLISRARIVLGARRLREQHFHRDLFGEPAWEILLALYISGDSGPRFTASKLAEWLGAPLTTVVRWIRTLEEEALVGRVDHPTDRRIVFIQLLEKGRKALEAYLRAIPG